MRTLIYRNWVAVLIGLSAVLLLPACSKKSARIKKVRSDENDEPEGPLKPQHQPSLVRLVDPPKQPPPPSEAEKKRYRETAVALACAKVMKKDAPLTTEEAGGIVQKQRLSVESYAALADALKGDSALQLAIKSAIENCPKPEIKPKKRRTGMKLRDYSHLKEMKRSQLSGVLSKHRARVQSCFSRIFKNNIPSGGKVRVRFTISPAGKATGVHVSATGIYVGTAKRCVQTVLGSVKFPSGHRPTPVSIPVTLKVKM